MEFAIVDIETTGGHAAGNSITEVAIYIHNGRQVVQQFETLINPEAPIPYYITGLTGINNQMVRTAPVFASLAQKIYELLHGRVFVAHAVNFDYSFLKNALKLHGYELNSRKLCTVRLSRKIFPGYPSYSLGNLCGSLGIPLNNRHRAGGDAAATVLLFEKLLQEDGNLFARFLKRGSKEQALPPNVPKEEFDQLPNQPGVYYFLNKKGKVVYVGKAADLKKRVAGHFTNNSPAQQKGEFMRHVFHIRHTVCASEATALALETKEIKRLWPAFNRAQKGYEPQYGIVQYFDQSGFKRLAVKKVKNKSEWHIPVANVLQAHDLLRKVAAEHELCLRLSGIAKNIERCREEECICCTVTPHGKQQYLQRVTEALQSLSLTMAGCAEVQTPPVFKPASLSLFAQ